MSVPTRRTIVLWCPDWPIFAACREHGARPGRCPSRSPSRGSSSPARPPRARRRRARAEAARGAVPLPRAHGARLRRRARRALFEPVVRASRPPCPGVQVLRPGTLAMRARGPARYYGGEDAAARPSSRPCRSSGCRAPGSASPTGRSRPSRPAARTRRPSRSCAAGESAAFIAPLPVSGSWSTRARRPCSTGSACARSASSPRCPPTTCAGASRGGRLRARPRGGREQARVVARTPPPEFEVEQDFEPPLDRVDQLAFAFRVGAEEFIERMRAVARRHGPSHRARRRGRRHSSRSWLHPRWFTPRRRRRPGAVAAAGRGHCRQRAAPRRSCGCGSMPERIDSTGNHEEGLWGGGPDERVHHGLTRVQSMLGHEAVVTAAIGGGRMLADRQVLVPWGDRPPERTGRRAPWPGSLPALAARERVPRAAADRTCSGAGRIVAIDARGAISAAPGSFAVGGGGRAGARLGGSVAGRRALVGRRARQARAPVPGRRRRRLRVAARARRRRLVGRGAVTDAGDVRLSDGLEQPRDPVVGARAQALRPASGRAGRRSSPTAATAPRGAASGIRTGPRRGSRRPAGPDRAVRRAARALHVQLPRRRPTPERARRGGGPARPARPRDHRPRRLLRRRAVRRGGRELRPSSRPSSAPSCRSASPSRRTASADPEGEPPAGARGGEEGYHRLAAAITEGSSRRREGPAGLRPRRAGRARRAGDWVVLTGCRKGRCARALADGGADAAGASSTGWSLFGRDNVVVELFDHGHPLDEAQRRARGARRAAGCRSSPPTTCTTRPPASTGSPRRWRRCGPGAASTSSTAGCPPSDGLHLRSGRRDGRALRRYPGAVAPARDARRRARLRPAQRPPPLPRQEVPEGHTPMSWLRELAWRGRRRGATPACPTTCATGSRSASSRSSSRRTSPATS